jgi:UDP-3-O-[3-hydroxymyristoyl] glucosamine N-acyltransferase
MDLHLKEQIILLELEKFPHHGKVVIENDVEIFANCSIARGSLSDTIIGQGTKIETSCHIAHNVTIGKDTELRAGTIVGGSTTIGNNCWLGLNSTIALFPNSLFIHYILYYSLESSKQVIQ